MRQLNFKLNFLLLSVAAAIVFSGCTKEPEILAPLAFFTFEADEENTQIIHFTNETENGETFFWEFGDGETSTEESPSHEYMEAGTFTVQLTATNEGGDNKYSQDLTVIASSGIEMVVNGDMSNADSWQYSSLNLNEATVFTFEDGVVKITNNNELNQSNGAIYQEIDVEAGDYLFSMDVTNDGTQFQTWIEVYFGTAAPVDGEDYENGGIQTGISAWDCPQENTDVNIIKAGCKGDLDEFNGGNGIISFSEAGKIYLVIKAGSWEGNLTTGYIIDNVSLISQ